MSLPGNWVFRERPPGAMLNRWLRKAWRSGCMAVLRRLFRRTRRHFIAALKNRDAKRRLAKVAATLIEDGDSLIIDCGSTTAYVAQALCDHSDLHVITNFVEIARTLASRNETGFMLPAGNYGQMTLQLLAKPQSILSSNSMWTTQCFQLGPLTRRMNSLIFIFVRQSFPERRFSRRGKPVL